MPTGTLDRPTCNQIEALIDSHSLTRVLESIALICREKADHIRENWQDKVTAEPWDKAARHIDSVADHVCRGDF